MRELGVFSHPEYKIMQLLDHGAMITVHTEKYGYVTPTLHVITHETTIHYRLPPRQSVQLHGHRKKHLSLRRFAHIQLSFTTSSVYTAAQARCMI